MSKNVSAKHREIRPIVGSNPSPLPFTPENYPALFAWKERVQELRKLMTNSTLKFPLGRVVATPAALQALLESKQLPDEFLARHQTGDWGEVEAEDAKANEDALNPDDPQRIWSIYRTAKGVRFYVITEWTREVTTLLLPKDY